MRYRRLAATFVLGPSLLAIASPAAASSPVSRASGSSDLVHLLRSMERRGELDAADASRLLDQARALLPDGTVRPPSSALARCSMVPRMEARRWAHERGGNLAYPPPDSVGFVASESLPLRVYYETPSDLQMAKDALTAAEDAWHDLIDELGYSAPFTDDESATPMQGLWLYVADSGMGGGGYTEPQSDVPSTPSSDCSSRVIIDSFNMSEDVEEVVYHEFVHTSQLAMDCAEAISAFENFAVAAEHVRFPYSYMFAMGFLPEFQAWPGYAIDYWTQNEYQYEEPLIYYQYGAALFPVFLKDRFGAGDGAYLPAVWRSFAQEGTVDVKPWKITNDLGNHPNWFEGLHTVLQAEGSTFHQGFQEFAQWRAAVGPRDDGEHFKFGLDYTAPSVVTTLTGATPASGTLAIREYGTQYVDYLPSGYQGGLRFTVTTSVSASFAADLLLWKQYDPMQVVAFEFDGLTGTAVVPSVAGLSAVTLAVSQLKDQSHVPDDKDYNNARTVPYTMELYEASEPGPEPGTEPQPEAGTDAQEVEDATVDSPASNDASLAASLDPADYTAGGGGCGCRVEPAGGSRESMTALLFAAWAAGLAGRRRTRSAVGRRHEGVREDGPGFRR